MMQVLKKIVGVPRGVVLFFRELRAKRIIKSLKRGKYYGRKNVPFVNQLQDVDESLVIKEYGGILDEKAAKRFGAKDLKEFSHWAWRSCGMANLAMVFTLKGVLRKRRLFDLVNEGLAMNGYAFKNRWGQTDIGWKHDCLVRMCMKEGLKAKGVKKIGVYEVMKEVLRGNNVIASINSKVGSHMVLVNGFKINDDEKIDFLVNNPYVFNGKGGKNVWYKDNLFAEMFLLKGIVIKNG
jgi:hypothetical protein